MLRSQLRRIPRLRKAVVINKGGDSKPSRRELLAMLPKESVGAEIGVHEGDFSAAILEVVHPYKLHLIDPWKYEEGEQYREALYGGKVSKGRVTGQIAMDQRYDRVLKRFAREIESGCIQVYRQLSSDAVLELDSLDWVYIDGNHQYEYVMSDLENYYHRLRPGGWLTGDDYGVEGWWRNGVQKAVDEFVVRHVNLRLEVLRSQFIIAKPNSH